MATQIYFDGGLRPHPNGGYAVCYGWVMMHDSAKVADGSGIERIEKNVGSCAVEYNALIHAMESAIELGLHQDDDVVIHGDSQVVINMAAGRASAQIDETIRFQSKVQELASRFDGLRFEWIPRELNQDADHLGRVAYSESAEIKRRIGLINEIHILSRRAFGGLYDSQVAEAWHLMLTGKRRFAQMSEMDLLKLLNAVNDIPAIINGIEDEVGDLAAVAF